MADPLDDDDPERPEWREAAVEWRLEDESEEEDEPEYEGGEYEGGE